MARNLDMTALRAFVTVAETGGVTRAAGILNLTQSAVSMQLKRLEDGLGRSFFSRAARQLALTAEGEQLLGYARRMLELNDEALNRLTGAAHEGEIRLGVPHDIVYPQVPKILKRMAAEFPRVRINLVSCFTRPLKEGLARGEYDAILTTEDEPDSGGERLARRELVWLGALGGMAWQARPLRLGFIEGCRFRPIAQNALDAAGIAWEMGVDGKSEQVVEASVAADLVVSARLRGDLPTGTEAITAANALPGLGTQDICFYPLAAGQSAAPRAAAAALAGQIRAAYAA